MPNERIALLTLAVLAAAPAHAEPAAAVDEAAAPDTAPVAMPDADVLSFGSDLHQRADITLPGTRGVRSVDLPIPRGWKLTGDPVLHVALAHSAALLPARSHLTVLLNETPVGSITLDDSNEVDGHADITLPRGLLQDYNTLRFSALQHYTEACEDPFDPALWTRVSTSSSITVPHVAATVDAGFESWPYPMVDARAVGPVTLTPVLSGPPSAETTRAAGRLALTLGRLASYHTLQVQTAVTRVSDATTPALLIGPASELPELASLLGPVDLAPTDGLLALVPNPSNPTLPVLVVTGGGAEGMQRAVDALTSQDRQPVLSGSRVVVHAAVASAPPPNTQATPPSPRDGVFPLSAVGFDGLTVRGYFSEPIRLPFRLEGDTYIRPGGGTLTLRYAYSAQLDTALSAMEVRMDGLSLRSVPLDHAEGMEDGVVSLRLPEELITPDSQLEVLFHLYPREFDICKRVSDGQIWGTVFGSSTMDVPRDHVADMPDLGRLRYDGWPLRADATDGRVVAVVPDQPDAEAWAAGLELAGLIGRTSMADAPAFQLDLASATSMSANADAHFVVLAGTDRNTVYDALSAAGALAITDAGAVRTLVDGAAGPSASAEGSAPTDTFEQILHPSNPQRSALVLRAGAAGGLARLVDAMGDIGKLRQLEGNAAVLSADGSLRTIDTAKRQRWGELPLTTEARVGVRQYWGVLGGGMLAAGLAFALLVRLWSRGPRQGA